MALWYMGFLLLNTTGNSYNADHAHADPHRIADHEFVYCESVPRAYMPI